MTSTAAVFGAVFATLYAAHQVADHWVQTEYQASTKGAPGRRRKADAAHGRRGLRRRGRLGIHLDGEALMNGLCTKMLPIVAIRETAHATKVGKVR